MAIASLILFSLIGIAFFGGIQAYGQETQIEYGKNYDREYLSTNPDGTQTYQWTSAPERIIDYYENGNELLPVWVDFKTHEDDNKIYFESAKRSLIFDKQSNTLEFYKGGNLDGSPKNMILTHTIKEAINGTDNWNPILENETTETSHTINGNGIQIVSITGDFKTIYDINLMNLEYTYEYTNNNPSKTNHKYGFTTVCEGVDCDTVEINGETLPVGQEKGRSDLLGKTIKVGNKFLDLKNEQHDYVWAMKHPENNKTVLDLTHSKGKLGLGETLTVDPSYSETYDTFWAVHDSGCNGGDTIQNPAGKPYFGRSGTNCYRQAVEWDITSIDDTATITDSIFIHSGVASGTGSQNCDIFAMATLPSVHSVASTFYTDMGDGTKYTDNANCPNGTITNINSDLGSSGDSDIESALSSNAFAIGWRNDDEVGNSYSYTCVTDVCSTPAPTLSITYTNPPPPLPDAPENLTCASEPYQYGCSWDAINASIVTGYDIAHSPNNSTWAGANVTSIGNVTSYDYTGFGIGEFNFIRVNATNVTGNSDSTNHVSNSTDILPDAPSLSSIGVSDTQIDLTRVAGASDGGDIIVEYDLRCEVNETGGWLSTVTNGTIINYYNYTGLSDNDDLTCQWRDRNGVGYSPYSSNATSTTFQFTTGTTTHSSAEIVGNVVLIEPTVSITTGLPSPTVNQLKVYLNGSLARTETVSVVIASGASNEWTDLLFVELPTGSTYNATVVARVTNTTGTVDIASAGEIVTREYAPIDSLGETPSLGYYNYTIDATDPANRDLKVNRPFDNATNTWDLSCKSITGFNEAGLTWYNDTNVGFYKETFSATSGQNVYFSCYNPDSILFSGVSYGNLTGVLAGFTGFDDQLGSWFGLPMIFMFVFFIAGLFGGRQSGTSMVITLSVIAILGGIGLIVIDEALWGIMLVLGALGLFASRVRF